MNQEISITVNGESKKVNSPPFSRLLDVLREEFKLIGTKEGCGEGECGACSVFVDGEIVNSCLVPVIQVDKAKVTTIEGVAEEDELNDIQQAFIETGGTQCGICTPGMIMAAVDLLKRCPQPTQEQIRENLAGNLCRCTGYTKIFDAVVKACQKT